MAPFNPLHILVIEDDPDTRANLCDILEQDSHRVESAGSAAEALARADWSSISAIILDRKFPGAPADDLLPRLKQAAPDAAVLAITGHVSPQGTISALSPGATDYILKPVEPDDLRTRMRRLSEYRQAQDAMRVAERRYRLLVQNTSDIITATDRDGTILYQSPTIERTLGYRPEDRVGTNILRDPIVHPDDLDAMGAFFEEVRCRAGASVVSKFRLRDCNCSCRYIEAMGENLLEEEGISAIVVSYRDVTERIRAEEALRRERNFAEGLIGEAPAFVAVVDAEGRIVRFNRFAEEITGYRAEEVLGQSYFPIFIPERNRAQDQESFRRALAEVDTRGVVTPILTRSGREREIRWSYRVLKDSDGGAIGVLAIGQDVTELNEAQERALRSERLAAIGQMVAVLTHESRNALQCTQACLEILARKVEDRPEAVGLIARLQEAQDRLTHLYEDVGGFAAPIRLELGECDLGTVWREAWAHLESERKGRQARLLETGCETDLRCQIDKYRLERVFFNILENSLAACPDPVEVRMACSPTEIGGRPAVCVNIRDNGPGLSPEARQRIFEPFYTTKPKGTGLGMAITRRIIEAHGGRIDVGEGTIEGAEFMITLPRGAL
ncbi:MAG: domain S-box [Planctomycetota bacterium]|nr:domain S-box [Planctomycetota bacterium]